MSIPKIIHYCWLNDDPVPASMQKNIDKWHELMPDYEVIKWDLTKFDKSSSPWVSEAIDNKKYAFAADYIRFYAVYNYGGIYMDTDIEVLKPFDDLLDQSYMFARERPDKDWIESGCFGAEKENEFLGKCLEYYEGRHFALPDGSFDMIPLSRVMASVARKNYLTIETYSWKYFTAKSFETGIESPDESTYAIHHFAASWKNSEELKIIENARSIRRRHPVIGMPVAFVYEKGNKTIQAFRKGGIKEFVSKAKQYLKR